MSFMKNKGISTYFGLFLLSMSALAGTSASVAWGDFGQDPSQNPSQNPGQNPGQNPDQGPGRCNAQLKVERQASDLTDAVKAGTMTTHKIAVTNLSDCAATGVRITDRLSNGVKFISADPTPDFIPLLGRPGGEIVWDGQIIGAGETRLYTVQVQFETASQIGESSRSCASQGLDPEVCAE